MPDHELIVVGAGALGAAVAWHGARLTGGDVLVLDRGQPCSGTSPRGAGLVNRLLPDPLDIGLVSESLAAFRELDALAGRAFTYHDPGGLLFARDEDADLDKLERLWKAQGLHVAELTTSELAEVPGGDELHLGGDERAFFVEGDGWCVTTDAVRAMLDQATAAGAQLQANTPVARAEQGAVVLEDGQRLTAQAVVVAAGCWTPRLLDHTWHVPLGVYRPQACALELEHPSPLPTVHDAVHHTYWRPEGPGKLVVGDGTVLTPQDPEGEPPVEPTFAEQAAFAVAKRWPRASKAALVRAWAGYEAGTPDRRPLVGPVPGTQGLFVCTGGNGFGFMRSPALGEACAHLALGRGAPHPVGPLDPGRLDWAQPTDFELREGFSLDRGPASPNP